MSRNIEGAGVPVFLSSFARESVVGVDEGRRRAEQVEREWREGERLGSGLEDGVGRRAAEATLEDEAKCEGVRVTHKTAFGRAQEFAVGSKHYRWSSRAEH